MAKKRAFVLGAVTARIIAVMLIVIWQVMPGLIVNRLWWWCLSAPVIALLIWSSVWREGWRRWMGHLGALGINTLIALATWNAVAEGTSAYYADDDWSYLGTHAQVIDSVAGYVAAVGVGLALMAVIAGMPTVAGQRREMAIYLRQYTWFDVALAVWLRRLHLVMWLTTLWVVGSYGFYGLWAAHSMGRTLALFMTITCMVFLLRLQLSSARWRRVVAVGLELPFNLYFAVASGWAMWHHQSYYARVESMFYYYDYYGGFHVTGWDIAGCALGCLACVLGIWLLRAEWNWEHWMDEKSRRDIEAANRPAPLVLPRDKEMDVAPGWDEATGRGRGA